MVTLRIGAKLGSADHRRLTQYAGPVAYENTFYQSCLINL